MTQLLERRPGARMATAALLVLGMLLGAAPATTAAAEVPASTVAWKQRNASLPDYADLQERLAQPAPLRWLFTGDSITHGIVHTRGHKRFTEYFEQYLRTTAVNGHDRSADVVLNTGVSSGRTVCPPTDPNQPCLDLFHDAWIRDRQADVVFIALAMNDGRQDPPLVPLTQFRAELEEAIDAVRAQGGIPVLQTQNGTQNGQMNANLEAYFNALREMAMVDDVMMVDVATYWRELTGGNPSAPSLMNDEIHPNDAGHLQWVRLLLDAVGLHDEGSELAMSGDVVSVPRTGPEINETYTLATAGDDGFRHSSGVAGAVNWDLGRTFDGATALNATHDFMSFANADQGDVTVRFRTSASFSVGQTMALASFSGAGTQRLEVTLFEGKVRIGRQLPTGVYGWFTGSRALNDGNWHTVSVNLTATALAWSIDGVAERVLDVAAHGSMAPNAYSPVTLTAAATGPNAPSRWYHRGDIDYIDTFARTLTQAEISAASSVGGGSTAAALMTPLYENTRPTMFSFIGGRTSVGVTDPIYAKNYIQLFEEVLRGENAGPVIRRMRYLSNASVDGLTSAGMLARYHAEVAPQSPGAVFVSPDVVQGGAVVEGGVGEFTSNIDAVLDAAVAAGAVAIVMTPATLDPAAVPYAEALRALAQESGIGLVDVHRWIAQQSANHPAIPAQWFTDGSLNAKGHLALGKFLMTQVQMVPGSGSQTWSLDYDGGATPVMAPRAEGEFGTVGIAGPDKEFSNYRIPGVIQLPNGDILAAYDGRPGGGDAPNPNSILQRRSTDGGKTWGVQTYVAKGSNSGTNKGGAWKFGYSDPSYVGSSYLSVGS